jgi:hypothetical protein
MDSGRKSSIQIVRIDRFSSESIPIICFKEIASSHAGHEENCLFNKMRKRTLFFALKPLGNDCDPCFVEFLQEFATICLPSSIFRIVLP